MIRLSIWQNGNKFWFLNNKWHRAIGPAVIWKDGHRVWFWYGLPVSEFEHMMLVAQGQAYG